MMPSEDMIILEYEMLGEEDCDRGLTNIAIASFVTSYARLELYQLFEKIGPKNVMYFDTDSVIYRRSKSLVPIENGDYLGELTDEVKKEFGDVAFITRYVSGGPKNYGFEIDDGHGNMNITMKIKGLCLNFEAKEQLQFESMINVCKQFAQHNPLTLYIPQFTIHSDKATHNVYTRYFSKVFRVVSDKRRPIHYYSFPYGFFA